MLEVSALSKLGREFRVRLVVEMVVGLLEFRVVVVVVVACVGVVGDNMTLGCSTVDSDLLCETTTLGRGDVSEGRRSRLLVGEATLTNFEKKPGAMHEKTLIRNCLAWVGLADN